MNYEQQVLETYTAIAENAGYRLTKTLLAEYILENERLSLLDDIRKNSPRAKHTYIPTMSTQMHYSKQIMLDTVDTFDGVFGLTFEEYLRNRDTIRMYGVKCYTCSSFGNGCAGDASCS